MNQHAPKATLSLFEAVAATAGIVIGVGIFRFPSIVAGALQNEPAIIAVWIAGGVISLFGALCYAELATAFPSAGGEYHFLSRAFGRQIGFLFAWARASIIQTGSIALLAFVLGDYLASLFALDGYASPVFAATAVLALTGLNIMGVRQAAGFQKAMFTLTLIGLAVLTITGLASAPAPAIIANATTPTISAIGTAMIFVLLTYGGWNEAAYISAEIRDGKRNMTRALLLSIGIVTLCYVAINMIYLRVLGVDGVAGSQAVAGDVMRVMFGETGAVAITILIVIVALTSLNVTIFTGARSNFALGRDFPPFRFLGNWNEKNGSPVMALVVQGAIALFLVGLGTISRGGVQTAVDYLSPVFWFFFLLTGIALFVLRFKEKDAPRPFRVPLYPLTPILFCLSAAAMLYSSLSFTGIGASAGVAVLVLGLPFLYFVPRGAAKKGNDR
jgi:APA family basic amino acid/polyamine antiporter